MCQGIDRQYPEGFRPFDLLVVGAGPGGYEIAAERAARGERVCLIERDLPGGTCLNRGCIPTKTLIAAAHSGLTWEQGQQRVEEVVGELRQGVEDLLKNVDIFRGEAVMTAHGIEVNGLTPAAHKTIIATGSAPAPLRCKGAEHAATSDEVLSWEHLPTSVIIIGGGVIGLEFASLLHDFGVKVHVLEYCREVLPGQDPDLAKRLRQVLTRRGVEITVGAEVTEIAPDGTVRFKTRKGDQSACAGRVIAAVGRRPVLPPGAAEALRLTPKGFIDTDTDMATSMAGIYAVGDVNGRCMLAHAAAAQARRAMGEEINLDAIPAVVFTTPEFASVGLSADQAAEKGIKTSVAKVPYASNGKALADETPEGLVKMVADKSGRIIGCQILGAHASDLIAEATLAVAAGMNARTLAATVHAHPTLAELIQNAAARIATRL